MKYSDWESDDDIIAQEKWPGSKGSLSEMLTNYIAYILILSPPCRENRHTWKKAFALLFFVEGFLMSRRTKYALVIN